MGADVLFGEREKLYVKLRHVAGQRERQNDEGRFKNAIAAPVRA